MLAGSRKIKAVGVLLTLFFVVWLNPLRFDLTFKDRFSSISSSIPPSGLDSKKEILVHKQNYSVVLVVARRRFEDVEWISRDLPTLQTAIYTVDDPSAQLKPPQNKGNEAMVYLTYIIDNYQHLPDISVFTHAHSKSWHNNDFLAGKISAMLQRLNGVRVIREGYVNLRCDWDPGCPGWTSTAEDSDRVEENERQIFRKAWAEIYPETPLPASIGQACCAQFAVSRTNIQSTPLAQWKNYRSWLLATSLENSSAGKVWEYLWQYVFTENGEWCPDAFDCYCDGFGICFESPGNMRDWTLENERQGMLKEEYVRAQSAGEETEELKNEIDRLVEHLRLTVEEAIGSGDAYRTNTNT